MIPPEDMPAELAAIATSAVELPRLRDDSPASCPCSMRELLDYLELEGEDATEEDLTFLRTAEIEGRRWWIW